MRIIGITGGVGAGKTEVMTYIGQHYDAAVIKADEVGYLLMEPGRECYAPIVRLFGRQITDESGNLNRKRIAELIFRDQEKLRQMNQIVHPAVKAYVRRAIAEEEKAGTSYVFIEAALLIEDHYDEIYAMNCGTFTQTSVYAETGCAEAGTIPTTGLTVLWKISFLRKSFPNTVILR